VKQTKNSHFEQSELAGANPTTWPWAQGNHLAWLKTDTI